MSAADRATVGGDADRGSVLVIVLGFVAVTGVVVVALMGQLFSTVRLSTAALEVNARRAVADASVDAVVAQALASADICATTQPTAVEIDGVAADVECSLAGGTAPGIGGFVLVAGSVGWPAAASGTLEVRGAVRTVLGQWGPADGAAAYAVTIDGGDLVTGDLVTDDCVEAVPAAVHLGALARRRCDPADVALPEEASTDVDEPPQDPAGTLVTDQPGDPDEPSTPVCRVFHPGTYQEAPVTDVDSFFEPGTYRFDDVGTWTIPADVYVAAGAASEAPGPCAGEAGGVRWILSGSTHLVVAGELHVAGALIAPDSILDLSAPGAAASFDAVVVDHLEAGAAITIGPGAAPSERTLRITAVLPATDAGPLPGRCTAVDALITLAADAAQSVRVDAWLPDAAARAGSPACRS